MKLLKRYICPSDQKDVQDNITAMMKKYHISNTIATIIYNRLGDNNVEMTINKSLDDLIDPRLMKDASKAASIINKHIDNNDLIVNYTDFDADGFGSGVVSGNMCRKMGANIKIFANTRDMGYGICKKGIDDIINMYPNVKLIITTDNGIVAFDAIDYVKSKGIDIIITDHHQTDISGKIPNADAVVNPHQKDDLYEFKDLCGCGVIWKVLSICYSLKGIPFEEAKKELDIVAFSTIADVVSIVDENRIIVNYGLDLISNDSRIQWEVFKKCFSVFNPIKNVDTKTIGFSFGPAVNAVSRMEGTIYPAIDIFFTKNLDEIEKKVKYLKKINDERKMFTNDYTNAAGLEAELYNDYPAIVIANEEFFGGIVGLIAGRIKELCNKPVIVFTNDNNGDWKGSGRSIEGYHIENALNRIKQAKPDLIMKFGGHSQACGLTIPKDKIEDFTMEFIKDADNNIKPDMFIKKEIIDFSFDQTNVNKINNKFFKEIESMEPFGHYFEKPVIGVLNLVPTSIKLFGASSQHLRLSTPNFEVICWYGANLIKDKKPISFTVCGCLVQDNFGLKLMCDKENIMVNE